MTAVRPVSQAAFLACLMIVGICAQGICSPLRVADDRKKEIEVPAIPTRIISLAPTNTELLFALGLDKEIVAVTQYCDYPEAANGKEKVGGFVTVEVERIAALKPDLILAFGTMQLATVDALEKQGMKVFWLYPRSVQDVLDSFERVGKITGRVREAKQLRAAVEKDLGDMQDRLGALSDEKRPSIFRLMSFNQPATIGSDSFQTDLFFRAGGKNAFPVAGKDYVELDTQELSKGNPDVVLVCGDDEERLKQKLKDSPIYSRLPAVRKGSILVIPCELTCRPGPRIAETARRIGQYLHPETH